MWDNSFVSYISSIQLVCSNHRYKIKTKSWTWHVFSPLSCAGRAAVGTVTTVRGGCWWAAGTPRPTSSSCHPRTRINSNHKLFMQKSFISAYQLFQSIACLISTHFLSTFFVGQKNLQRLIAFSISVKLSNIFYS